VAEKQFQQLPAKDALHALFPEIAKGFPGRITYADYNCYEPLHDRKVPGWGEFCVVHWLWCKELACPEKRNEVGTVLLELWSHPVSLYGQKVLLRGLCGNSVGTMLAEMGEHQLTIRDYLRHSNLHVTNLQATSKTKRLAQDKLVDAILPTGILAKTNLIQRVLFASVLGWDHSRLALIVP
jgi:hypothetical protein